jgi:hypothetical protein
MLMPVFIQNKFSELDATTRLDYDTVKTTYQNSKKFLTEFGNIQGKETLLKQERFLLVMAVRRETTGNIYQKLPGNIYILDNNKLKELYGPSLSTLLFSFTQEGPYSIAPPQGSATGTEQKEVSTEIYLIICCYSRFLFSF